MAPALRQENACTMQTHLWSDNGLIPSVGQASSTSYIRKPRYGLLICLTVLALTVSGCETVSDTYDDVMGWLDDEDETTEDDGSYTPVGAVPTQPTGTPEERRTQLRRELGADTPNYSEQTLSPAEATAPPTDSFTSRIQPLFPASPVPQPSQTPQIPIYSAPQIATTPPIPANPMIPTAAAPSAPPTEMAVPSTGNMPTEGMQPRMAIPASSAANMAANQAMNDPYAGYYSQRDPTLIPPTPSPTAGMAPNFGQSAVQPIQTPQPSRPIQAIPSTAFPPPIMYRRTPAPAALAQGGGYAGRPGGMAGLIQPVNVATLTQPANFGNAEANFVGNYVRVGTIYFGNGSSRLGADDVAVLKQIAELYRKRGGGVQIIGHASQRTQQLSYTHHKMTNYTISLRRGARIQKMLQKFGVDPHHIAVTAQADAAPIYLENMPAGEAGNRRAEIFMAF